MHFGVLGHLQVLHRGREISISSGRHRALLAALLLRPNQAMSIDALAARVWDNELPQTPRTAIQGYVSRLRRLLPEAPIHTRPGGYAIAVATGQLDLTQFDELVRQARDADQPEQEVALLAEAIGLWRGPALTDVPSQVLHRDEVPALTERRLAALERRIDLDLAAGRPAAVVAELQALVAEHPLRERFWAQLLRALAGCGRPAEALRAYGQVRDRLADELGADLSPELRDLHRAILRGEPLPPGASGSRARREPVWAPVPPAQLPADVAAFTGRAGILTQLDSRLPGPGNGAGSAVVISAIEGSAGIGKTALAVHWGHRVRDRFPDGQLYANLRGYTAAPAVPGESGQPVPAATPARPIEVLAGFLPALGVPADQVPASLDRASALFRSVLADRRVLVVLDNAADPEQVRPLLPGSAGCLVLVTSRDQLGGLAARDGAHRLVLDRLAPHEARRLLTRLLGSARVRAEPAAADELAELCGRLPLALRIAAANLTDRPGQQLADFAARLRDSDRLNTLAVEGDPESAVRPAFDLSYQRLPEGARRLFRLAGLVPGPDLTAPAAAALAGIGRDQSGRLLGQLAGAHLFDQPVPGRYALHDLLRHYAAGRAQAEDRAVERRSALRRLSDHYLHTADAATRQLYPHKVRLPRQKVAGAPDRAHDLTGTQALAWLDAELPNLFATVTQAAAHGPRATAWLLVDALRAYLDARLLTLDGLAAARTALAAAEAAQDLPAQASAVLTLGNLTLQRAGYPEAAGHFRRAKALAERAGWLPGASSAANNHGLAFLEPGQLPEAARQFTAALALAADRPGDLRVGPALANLSLVCLAMGRLELAGTYADRALAVCQQHDDPGVRATAHATRGGIAHVRGLYRPAGQHFIQALDGYRAEGHYVGEAETLRDLAALHRDTGDRGRANELAGQAVSLAQRIGDQRLEAGCEAVLGSIRTDPPGAIDHYRHALELAAGGSAPAPRGQALVGLAIIHQQLGQPEVAISHVMEALEPLRQTGHRLLQARALTVRAGLHLDCGEIGSGIACAEAAMQVHQETGCRLEQARTHLVLGRAQAFDGGPGEAAARHWQQALALFTELGSPNADRARALLARAG